MLDGSEWNFDGIPDGEVIACCYWEYGRESRFLRDLRQRCIDPRARKMTNLELWKFCGDDVERVQSIGYTANVFLRGFFLRPADEATPDEGNGECAKTKELNGFPAPWQDLPDRERVERSHIGSDRASIPLVPFERGYPHFAEWIAEYCDAQRKRTFEKQDAVKAANPGVSEMELFRGHLLKGPEVRPSLFEAGSEQGIFRIQWADFTNEELRDGFYQWSRANRPEHLPAPDGRGHKLIDWRAKLTRLAAMRLLSRFSPADILDAETPEARGILEGKQFAGRKWMDEGHWRRARREALTDFHGLFPFLEKNEKPLSWKREKGEKADK